MARGDDVAGCAQLGVVNAQTTDRILNVGRSDVKIREELAGLARNQAADLGGDAVVPTSTPEAGRQSFDVYRCRDAAMDEADPAS